MVVLKYDGTFEGFLTLVFDCFDLKLNPEDIVRPNEYQPGFFRQEYEIITDEGRAKRVWNGLQKRISEQGCQMIYYVSLSEEKKVEMLMLQYIKKIFASKINIEANMGDPDVLAMEKISHKVLKEAGRIPMFVRFQKTADDIYFAAYSPQYNILPLVTNHFKNRFTDQKWMIYDTHRNYGFYFDLQTINEVKLEESTINKADGSFAEEVMAADEKIFQELWKNYYKAICIKERLNPKLHMKLMPKRFWKFLIEKQP
jgi:probable DNA metabolism protein